MIKTSTAWALGAVLTVVPLASAQAQHATEGSWIWVNRAGGHASQQNRSTFKVNADNRSAKYCYDTRCWNVALVVRGNAYTFSTGGSNLFEFESGSPGDMIGRYWGNGGNTAVAPDAVFRSR